MPARFQDFRVTRHGGGRGAHRRARSRGARRSWRQLRAQQSAAEAVEEVRHAEVRRRPQRALRRSRRRRPARHADRAEHPEGARRRLRPHQLPDRGHARRQGPVAARPARIRGTACSPTTRRSRFTTSTATARTRSCWSRDFQLQVLDGRTGKLLRRAWLPHVSPDAQGPAVRAQQRRLDRCSSTLGRHGRAARHPASRIATAASGSSTRI